MIDKKNILKMTKAVFRKSQGYPDRKLMHPQREWGIGLIIFIGVVIVGSVFAGNVFVEYQHIDVSTSESNESIPSYKKSVVQDALETYRSQTDTYTELQNQIPSFTTESTSSPEVEISTNDTSNISDDTNAEQSDDILAIPSDASQEVLNVE